MKAYTDIEQSQELAEILPPESADMKWYFWKTEIDAPKLPTFGYGKEAAETCKSTEVVYLPCWSLSALVNVLPRIDIEKEIWSSEKYDYRVKAFIGDGYVGDWYDNPIDACVEMIVKLKEKDLI